MQESKSLYEQLGGEEMVTKMVSIFYRKVLADPRLKPFFEHMDMGRLESMQRMFLSTAPYLSFAGAHLPRLKIPVPLHLIAGRAVAAQPRLDFRRIRVGRRLTPDLCFFFPTHFRSQP